MKLFKVIRNDGCDVLHYNFDTHEEAEAAIKEIYDPENHPFTYRIREIDTEEEAEAREE